MQKNSTIAAEIAVLVFFITAIIGWLNNLSPSTCAVRSIIVSVVIYYIVKIAIRLITGILIDHVVKSKINEMNHNKNNSNMD